MNMKIANIFLSAIMLTAGFTCGAKSTGSYTNPIIHADYSDPDAIATPDGSAFYMTASSFQCAPGLPILKSHNLVDWEIVNYALPAVPPEEFYGAGIPRHGKGVWAPSIRYHNGEYYIFWGDPDFGIFMIKTDNPEGEWSSPVLVKSGKGLIDPTPLWDDDGRAYLVNGWAGSRSGFNSVLTISEMLPDATALITEPRIVFDGNDGTNHTVEGPKLYKKDGYYYILAPAGGVVDGFQLAMRSKDIYGPYESKTVMARGNTDINGPHQGAWVTDSAGDDWFLHFQDKGAYGRVLHLNPMEWKEGWPVIGEDKDGDGCGQPVKSYRMPATSAAASAQLSTSAGKPGNSGDIANLISREFSWHSNYSNFFGFDIPSGLKRIYSHKLSDNFVNFWEVPNLWLMKFPEEEFTFTTEITATTRQNLDGISSGVIIMGWDYCRLGLTGKNGEFVLQLAECYDAENGGKESIHDIATISPERIYNSGLVPNIERSLVIKVEVKKNAECSFSYSLDGKKFEKIPYTFKARQGKWIGAKIGYYSTMPSELSDRGWIDVKSAVMK